MLVTVQAPLNGYGIRPLKSLRDGADAHKRELKKKMHKNWLSI